MQQPDSPLESPAESQPEVRAHSSSDRLPRTGPLRPPYDRLPIRSDWRPEPAETIRSWLAGAHDAPNQARTEWTEHRLAILPCGRRFGAVRIPGAIVHAAVGSDDREALADALRAELRGPVIHDVRTVGPTYWALLPWRPHLHWDGAADTPYLGPGTYLGVPDVDHTEPPGSYWTTPPRHQHDFCDPGLVFDFIVRGRHQLRTLQETDRIAGPTPVMGRQP